MIICLCSAMLPLHQTLPIYSGDLLEFSFKSNQDFRQMVFSIEHHFGHLSAPSPAQVHVLAGDLELQQLGMIRMMRCVPISSYDPSVMQLDATIRPLQRFRVSCKLFCWFSIGA